MRGLSSRLVASGEDGHPNDSRDGGYECSDERRDDDPIHGTLLNNLFNYASCRDVPPSD